MGIFEIHFNYQNMKGEYMFYMLLTIMVLTLISAKYLLKIRWKWDLIERRKRKAITVIDSLGAAPSGPDYAGRKAELRALIEKM